MRYKILIIGYGSIGTKYYNLLKKQKNLFELYVLSKRFNSRKNFGPGWARNKGIKL